MCNLILTSVHPWEYSRRQKGIRNTGKDAALWSERMVRLVVPSYPVLTINANIIAGPGTKGITGKATRWGKKGTGPASGKPDLSLEYNHAFLVLGSGVLIW